MKKVNVEPRGLCPRCEEPWNIHDCPSISHYEIGQDEPVPVGNGHPDFDMLLDLIAIKYRAPIEEVTQDDQISNAMTAAYNEALGDIVRICTMNWSKHPEIKRLKELATENAGWVNSWLKAEIDKL